MGCKANQAYLESNDRALALLSSGLATLDDNDHDDNDDDDNSTTSSGSDDDHAATGCVIRGGRVAVGISGAASGSSYCGSCRGSSDGENLGLCKTKAIVRM